MSAKKRKRCDLSPSEKCTCAICFEEKEIKDLTILNNCSHRYCSTCILKWCEKENSCPQCKKRITMLDIPGRQRKKRIKFKNLKTENTEESEDEEYQIINMAIMNYVASPRFRRYMAQTVLRRNNMRASILWGIIQRAIPILNRDIQQSIIADSNNISQMSMDILDATDAMLRLRNATSRSEYRV